MIMDDADGLVAGSAPSNVFPFLSMLFCALGAMLLLWVAASLFVSDESPSKYTVQMDAAQSARVQARQELTREQADFTALAREVNAMEQQLDQGSGPFAAKIQAGRSTLEQLNASVSDTEDRLGQLSVRKSQYENSLDALQRLRNKDDTRAQTVARIASLKKSIAELQQCQAARDQILALESTRQRLSEQWEQMMAEGAHEPVTLRVGPVEDQRLLVTIDVNDDGIVFHETALQPASEEAAEGVGERVVIDTGTDISDAELEKRVVSLARKRNTGYVLVLVRPGHLSTFARVVTALRKWRVPFMYEPAEPGRPIEVEQVALP
jgi:septal ring factor EnvC (AmiA/AmiB activator)